MAPKPVPLSERLWRHVEKTDGCWLWTGAQRGGGYGAIWVGTRNEGGHRPAHKVAWELTHGPVPDGMFVCHKCDVRTCVRPDHLFLGDHRANMADMAEKGRAASGEAWPTRHRPRGEANHNARLRESDIPKIRKLYADGFSSGWIANAFGVSKKSVLNVLHRRTWGQVP